MFKCSTQVIIHEPGGGISSSPGASRWETETGSVLSGTECAENNVSFS